MIECLRKLWRASVAAPASERKPPTRRRSSQPSQPTTQTDEPTVEATVEATDDSTSLSTALGPQQAIDALRHTARNLEDFQQFDAALQYRKEALDIASRACGRDSAQYADALLELATNLRRSGDAAEALPVYEEALALQRCVGDATSAASALWGLAKLLRDHFPDEAAKDRMRALAAEAYGVYETANDGKRMADMRKQFPFLSNGS